MTEEDKIIKAYRQYQFGSQGIDVYEEGAFRQGWEEAKRDLDLSEILRPFWVWLIKEAKVEPIDVDIIQVNGLEENHMSPVVTFEKLLELYKNKQ